MTKLCPVCQRNFTPSRVSQIYCPNRECKTEAERIRRRVANSSDPRPRSEFGTFIPQPASHEHIFEEEDAARALNVKEISTTETKYNGKRLVLLVLGDLHYGHPTSNHEAFKGYLQWAGDREGTYVLFNGDLMENVVQGSIGNLFSQKIDPQQQIDGIVEMLTPIAKTGRVIGYRSGNHERRTYRLTGIDPAKIIASKLEIPYLSSISFHRFLVGKQEYTAVSCHGASSARLMRTKMLQVEKMANIYDADVYIQGHMHDLFAFPRQYIALKDGKLIQRKRYFICSGHFLGYFSSYAEERQMEIGKSGAPKVKFYGEASWDIHCGV